MRLLVGISGASGAIYGLRLLEVLAGLGVEARSWISADCPTGSSPGWEGSRPPEGLASEAQVEREAGSGVREPQPVPGGKEA